MLERIRERKRTILTRRGTLSVIAGIVASIIGGSRVGRASDSKSDEPWTSSGTVESVTMNPSTLPDEHESSGTVDRPEYPAVRRRAERRRSGETPQPPADQIQRVPEGGDS